MTHDAGNDEDDDNDDRSDNTSSSHNDGDGDGDGDRVLLKQYNLPLTICIKVCIVNNNIYSSQLVNYMTPQ